MYVYIYKNIFVSSSSSVVFSTEQNQFMGSNQSTTFRKVQPSLPYSHHYDRLSSSSSIAENQQPLLLDIANDQGIEQLKLEFDANLRKNESLEKKNTDLKKEIEQLKAAISKLEFKDPAPEKKNNLEREIQELKVAISKLESLPLSEEQKNINGILEREICDLKAAVSKLESRPHSTPVVQATNHPQSDRALKREVNTLTTRVMKLELDTSMSLRKQEIDKVVKKNAALESKISELNITVEQLKSASFNVKATDLNSTPAVVEPVVQGFEMNDIFSCLLILIFLISVLIGVNL